MQKTVKQEQLDYGLFERVGQAAQWLRSTRPAPAKIRVVGDDDSDGTTSAFVLARALRREEYDVEVHLQSIHTTQDVDAAIQGDHDLFVVADSGSAFVEYLDSFGVPILVLDHHRVHPYEPRNVFEVNPRHVGGDDVDFVSASVVSQLFADALDRANAATAFAALAGGIADRQHLSGFHGLIDHMIDEAVASGLVRRTEGLTLPGRTVTEAIVFSLDPYFNGLTGDEDATGAFLKDLGVDPQADPRELTESEAKRVGEALTGRLADQGVVLDRIYPAFGLQLPLHHPTGIPTVYALTRILETLTVLDEFELALDVLAGDAKAAETAWNKHLKRTREVLKEVDRMRGHVRDMDHVRVAETKDTSDTGIYAHILLTYVFGDDKPFLVSAASGPKKKFSGRGSPELYRAGVDLSIAMQEAAEALGGNGGGHPAASGAAVPKVKEDTFLESLDRIVGRLRRGTA